METLSVNGTGTPFQSSKKEPEQRSGAFWLDKGPEHVGTRDADNEQDDNALRLNSGTRLNVTNMIC
jgi:hypothetical protein